MTKEQTRKRAFRNLRGLSWNMVKRISHTGNEASREYLKGPMIGAELRQSWGSAWSTLRQTYT